MTGCARPMKITDVNPSRRCGGEDRLVILPQAEAL